MRTFGRGPLALPPSDVRTTEPPYIPRMRPVPVIPISVAIASPDRIAVTWKDGRIDQHRARELRLRCLCARCVHEWTGEAILDPASVPGDLTCLAQQTVGNYAVRFTWSDGHSAGLYTYALLRAWGGAPA